jgi:hypothetical protein
LDPTNFLEAYELIFNAGEKKLLLAELRIESFGAPGRKVGPAISEKVYRVFVETNGAAKIN